MAASKYEITWQNYELYGLCFEKFGQDAYLTYSFPPYIYFIVRVILHFLSKLYREPAQALKAYNQNKTETSLEQNVHPPLLRLLIYAMACSSVLSSVMALSYSSSSDKVFVQNVPWSS